MRALAIIVGLAACGNGAEECRGVGDAGVSGATITVGSETFGYGGFDWGKNNDCGPESVTIQGRQVSPPSDFGIGLCLPRPDDLGAAPVPLSDRTRIELRGAAAQAGGCTYQFSSSAAPSGTVTFGGLCTTAGAAFTMTLAGTVAGTRTCADAGPAEPITLVLGGTALVNARP
jgi:hypothetical protein